MPDTIYYVTAKRGGPLVMESTAVLPPGAEYASGNIMESTNGNKANYFNGGSNKPHNYSSIPNTTHFVPHTQLPAYQIQSTSVGNTPFVNVLSSMDEPIRDYVDDALGFIDEVRKAYFQQHDIYSEFLTIMRDFKAGQIGIKDTVTRISYLFIDHKELIYKFKMFLPFGYKIELALTEDSNKFQVIVSCYNGIGSIHVPANESNFMINVESSSL